ncbi:MAG: DUF6525 family protein [Pseudomonadota bacterium]
MPNNQGRTSLKRSRRPDRGMREYDGLPRELRAWMAQAHLPWGVRSVRSAYERALMRTGSIEDALASLDRAQARLLARDAAQIWGADHPQVGAAHP